MRQLFKKRFAFLFIPVVFSMLCFAVTAQAVTMTSPNGGENWLISSTYNITWTGAGSTMMNLWYTTNNGTSWITVVNGTTVTSPYSWTVPNSPSTLCRVKVFNSSGSEHDSSHAVFSISAAPIVLTAPAGGENWFIGNSYGITWTPTDPARWLFYSTDNGNNWTTIAGSVSGLVTPYAWTIPNTRSSQAKVLVIRLSDNARDSSHTPFNITTPMTVTSPNGGENWSINSSYNITWSALHNPVTYIYYSTNNGTSWVQINHNSGGYTSPYSWTIPNTPSTSCRVKVSDESNTERDSSDAVFTINTAPVVLTAPVGGETWAVGVPYNITWTPTDLATTLYYSTNNGSSWITIANSGSGLATPYSWTIPNTLTTQAKVKVVMSDGRHDSSHVAFTIAMPMTVTSPNGGENWVENSVHNVTWTAIHDPVTYLYYSTNNGTSWVSLQHTTGGIPMPYSWTVPSTAGAQYRIKVTNETSTERDSSDAVFTVSAPPVVLTAPVGGETWAVGVPYNITWTPTDVANTLYYSTNNGSSWITIASSSTPGLATPYSWTIPNTVSGQCIVRVVMSDGRHDSTHTVFTIAMPITVTAPNGGENWQINSTHNITWTAIHDPVTYLFYSTNNGTSWVTINHMPTGMISPYSWTLPSTAGTQYRVKATNETSTERDSSDAIFTVSNPPVVVTSPNGGENWAIGATYGITWTPSTDYANTLYYSTNNGTSWTVIASSSTPGLSTPYSWTVPNIQSTQCRIKMVTNDGRTDSSDAVFAIRVPVTVTAPNGGENWVLGSQHNITWTAIHDPVTYINYSTDNGVSWLPVLHNSGGITQPYVWTVPSTVSVQCRVKVSNETLTEFDSSDAVFTISRPPVVLTYPVGGENWLVNSSYNITWSPTDPAYSVSYSTNGGSSWTVIASSAVPGLSSPYNWMVPNLPTTQARIKVVMEDGRTDSSHSNFNIILPMTLTAPLGGENWVLGTTHDITWTALHDPVTYMFYSTDNGTSWISIQHNAGGIASPYHWTVPSSPSTQCKAKISNEILTELDSTRNPFTISNPPVNVTAPNGGENWMVGSTYNISWAPTDHAFQLAYSTDNGTNWTEIASSGSPGISTPFPWTIPFTPSTQCKVRVVLLDGRNDVSDNPFTITNPMTLTAPNGGQNFVEGATTNITWTALHNPVCNIYYSTDNGVSWLTVAQNAGGFTSPYVWTVPNTPSTNCRVKVFDATNFEKDSSDNVFTISLPPMNVTAPNGGENFFIGQTTNITWSPGAPAFQVAYSTDNGANYTEIASSGSPGLSTPYPWTIPNTPSGQCRVRVFLLDGRVDASDNVFSITVPMTLTAPNGGENFVEGATTNITWSALHNPVCNIYYSTNNGASWLTVAQNSPGGFTSPYVWTVPNTPSTTCRVKVFDATNFEQDSSDNVFTISLPPMNVTAPNGGENFFVGQTTNITWSPGAPAFQVAYSTDNGTTYTEIASSGSPGLSTPYPWTIPNTPSGQCKVRVFLIDGRVDVSDNVFSITVPMTLTAPNGGENYVTGSTHNITWSALHDPVCYIYYSTNSGNTWLTVAANAPTGIASPYSWTVPNTPSTQCLVKVFNATNTEIDSSNALFTISVPPVVLTAPNGGEGFFVGGTTNVTWSPSSPAQYIYLTTNNGSSWTTIANSNSPGVSTPFPWTIPNSPSTQCRVKILLLDGRIDSSDAVFSISIPTTLTSPIGGENWQTSSTHNITWSALHNPVTDIYYSTNNGAGWITVSHNAAGIPSPYSWTVPVTPSTLCRVRVSDAGATELDSSHAVFTISSPPVVLTAPNGGENFFIGGTTNVMWTPSSPAQYIYLSTNNGSTWTTIANSNNPGVSTPFPWTIPNSPSTQCRVKILLLDGRVDSSDAVFSITVPMTLTSPVGGENWQTGSTHNITWSALHNPVTDIYYSTNNGAGWISVQHSAGGITSPFSWTIPNSSSIQSRVRISDSSASERDSSHAVFTISVPPVVLTAPNGGQNLFIGSSTTITWTPTDPARWLDYSTDNGATWINIAGGASPGLSTPYPWTIPNTPTAQSRVRVIMLDGRRDSSDAAFNITTPTTLNSPVGGENWLAGNAYNITWTALHNPVCYIYYSTNNGTSWLQVGYSPTGYTSPYSWTVPTTASTTCRVKVYDLNNTERDSSHAVFTISLPPVAVTAPAGGESWRIGASYNITWSPTNTARWINYSTNNGATWVTIAGSVSGISTPFPWTVPNTPTTQGKVQVILLDGRSDSTHTSFSIVVPMILNSPVGGENWTVGNSYNISWTANHNPVAYIYYTTNNGTSWIQIAQNPVGFTSPYSWTIPNTPATTCRVKVYDFNNTERDSSHATFTIGAPVFAVTAPNGGENWFIGSSHNITWNVSTSAQTISYSTNNGSTWIQIANSGTGISTPFPWTIPNTPSAQCRVKVLLLDARKDSSDAVFSITAPTTLLTPNGGENWGVGGVYDITWSALDLPVAFIYYSTNNGSTWINVAQNPVGFTSPYHWTVPNTVSAQCRVLVYNYTNTERDSSNAVFSISAANPPGTPSNLTISANLANGNVVLNWTAATGSPVGYKIYRNAVTGHFNAPGSGQQIGTVTAPTTTFTDTAAVAGVMYFYRVTAYNNFSE